MTTVRRFAAAAVLLGSMVALTACGRTPRDVPEPRPPVPSRLDGTLFFLGNGPERGGIWSLRGDRLHREVANDSDSFQETVTLSPDGTHYAWVEGGRLRISELGRSGVTEVGEPGIEATFPPQWTTDNGHLIVRYDDAKFGVIDISSGTIAPLAGAPEPYVAFSVDDAVHAVYGNASTLEWHVITVGPEATPSLVLPVPFKNYIRFHSLAPDGRHAVALLRGFAEPIDQPTRTLAANAVVDLLTGTAEHIPGGGTVRQGFFRADGGAVLRVSEGLADRMLLIAPNGDVSDRVDLPAGVVDLSLLGYAPTPAPASPPPTPTPTPTPSPTPPPVVLDGTLFFLGEGLSTLHDGNLVEVANPRIRTFAETVTVSPDGTHYAFIDGRRLRVAALDGDPATVGESRFDNSVAPQWSADSGSLLVRDIDGTFGYVNVQSGSVTPLPGAAYRAVSPDGSYAVVGDEPAIVHMGDAPVPVVVPEGQRIDRYQSFSPDGRHAIVLVNAVDEAAPDDSRTLAANTIIDLTTGEAVPVPGGGSLREGFFQADGTVVLRVAAGGVDRIVLVSRTGDVLDDLDLPTEVAELALLSYAPRPN